METEGERGNGDLSTAALWAPERFFGVSRVLSDTQLRHKHTDSHTCKQTGWNQWMTGELRFEILLLHVIT